MYIEHVFVNIWTLFQRFLHIKEMRKKYKEKEEKGEQQDFSKDHDDQEKDTKFEILVLRYDNITGY